MRDQFTSDGIILDNAVAFWVHRVYQASRNEMYRAFREEGVELTPEQWSVLVRLWERDGRTQNDLCDSTFRDKPTMSRMIAGLEERGLVRRRVAEDDGRSRIVSLTPEGQALKGRLVPVARALVARMLDGVSDADLHTTRSSLMRMFQNLTA
jgi:MarR family transcriptional regulator, organic hydroperoxide resistance regulator